MAAVGSSEDTSEPRRSAPEKSARCSKAPDRSTPRIKVPAQRAPVRSPSRMRTRLKRAWPRSAPGSPTKDQSPSSQEKTPKRQRSNMLPTSLQPWKAASKKLQRVKVQFKKAASVSFAEPNAQSRNVHSLNW